MKTITKEYKYSTKIDASFKYINPSKDLSIASLGLEGFAALLPEEEKLRANRDLQYIVGPAFVANLINANGDGIMTKEALAVSPNFVDRFIDIEHDSYSIVGHINNFGYSDFNSSDLKEASEFENTKDPFTVSMAGVIYKAAYGGDFCDFLKDTNNPNSFYYGEASFSWELLFNDFAIALGSKNLSEAEIVTDASKIKELSTYLVQNGGSGFLQDGTPVYRIVVGDDIISQGMGIVRNPAAPVKGILTSEACKVRSNLNELLKNDSFREDFISTFLNEEDDVESAILEIEAANKKKKASKHEYKKDDNEDDEVAKNTKKVDKKETQSKKTQIKINNSVFNIMEDITQDQLLDAIKAALSEVMKDQEVDGKTQLPDNTVLASKFSDIAAEKLKEYQEQYVKVRDALASKEQEAENLQNEMKDLKDRLDNLEKTNASLEKEKEAKAKEELFQLRMNELDSEFELSKEQRKAIAAQILEIADPAKYDAWKANFELFATKKTDKVEPKKVEATKDSQKNEEISFKESVANFRKKVNSGIPASPKADNDVLTHLRSKLTDGVKVTVS